MGVLKGKGSGGKSMQRKRTRTKRGPGSIGRAGALLFQVQSLYRGSPRQMMLRLEAIAAKCLSSQNHIAPAARPIRSHSTGCVRELAQAFRGNGSRSLRASPAASHHPFASSHVPQTPSDASPRPSCITLLQGFKRPYQRTTLRCVTAPEQAATHIPWFAL